MIDAKVRSATDWMIGYEDGYGRALARVEEHLNKYPEWPEFFPNWLKEMRALYPTANGE
jgi:hypothetical protein